MNLELHHFFILVGPEAKVADSLLSLGMKEGTRNKHEGQGTSNRRFNLLNGTLEFIWVHDEAEAHNGPGRDLLLPERVKAATASPFGIILNRKDNACLDMPFEGWKYEPVYFELPWAFHVGANSSNILEPLCIYMPFIDPESPISHKITPEKIEPETIKSITKVHIYTPSQPLSDVLDLANRADRLSVTHGEQHLMEITFDEGMTGQSNDLRPDIPLIIHW